MQLVFFLLLPSALLSNQFLIFAAADNAYCNGANSIVDWHAILNVWFVVGCFGLASRWLEKVQQQCFEAVFVSESQKNLSSPVWMLRHREPFLLWLWCLMQPICLVATGWTQWTQSVAPQARSQAVHLSMMLSPSIALLLLLEILRCSRTWSHPRLRSSWILRLAYTRKELARIIANTWLVPLSLPILIAGIVDLGSMTGVAGPNQGLLGVISCTLATASLVTILIPHLFTRLIGAGSVDETVETAVKSTWRIGSNRVPQIMLWPTGCRMANAAVIGLFGYGRKLLLTDALLQRLNEKELSMVVLHELAHCKRCHSWVRMAPTLLAVALLLAAMNFLDGMWLSLSCMIILVIFVVGLIALCWWTEFDADRMAIQLAVRSSGNEDRESLVRLHATELSTALRKIYGARNMDRMSWMHPSCSQRIAAIQSQA